MIAIIDVSPSIEKKREELKFLDLHMADITKDEYMAHIQQESNRHNIPTEYIEDFTLDQIEFWIKSLKGFAESHDIQLEWYYG